MSSNSKKILILAGDHVYKMDYWVMLRDHVQSGRKVTVGCIEVPRRDAHAFGVMAIDDQEQLEVGDLVLALGNPFGVGQTVTMGIISATGRNQLGLNSYEDFI